MLSQTLKDSPSISCPGSSPMESPPRPKMSVPPLARTCIGTHANPARNAMMKSVLYLIYLIKFLLCCDVFVT